MSPGVGCDSTAQGNKVNLAMFTRRYLTETNNMQAELIRFRNKYRLYSCLLLRSEVFNVTRLFTLGKSLQHKPVR